MIKQFNCKGGVFKNAFDNIIRYSHRPLGKVDRTSQFNKLKYGGRPQRRF